MKVCLRNRIDELALESEGIGANNNASFCHVLLSGLPLKGMAQIQVGLSTSHDPVKKTPRRHPQLRGFQLTPDAIKLTGKISSHKYSQLVLQLLLEWQEPQPSGTSGKDAQSRNIQGLEVQKCTVSQHWRHRLTGGYNVQQRDPRQHSLHGAL